MIELRIGAHANHPDNSSNEVATRRTIPVIAAYAAAVLSVLATSACESGNYLLADSRTSFVDDANVIPVISTIDAGVNTNPVDATTRTPSDGHGNPYRGDAGTTDAGNNTAVDAAPAPTAVDAAPAPAAVDAATAPALLVTITSTPSNPSADSSAAFGFSANEPATFQCQIDGFSSFTACSSVTNYDGLLNGTYTFRVVATDDNGNTNEADYQWLVQWPTLAEDCAIRWGESTSYNSNVEVMSTDDSFLINGFRFDTGETAESDSAVDGSQIWSDDGQGYFGAANSGTTKGIYNSCGGGGLCITSIDLTTGDVESSSFYSAITAGWSNVGNRFAVQPTGEFIVGEYDSPISWDTFQQVPDWQIQPDSTVISDVGPGSVLFRHAADGSFVGYVNIPNVYVSETIALSDGRWSVLLQNWSSDPAPFLSISLPAGSTSLVTLAADFSSATLDSVSSYASLYNVAGTTLRVVDDGNVEAYDDAGLVWQSPAGCGGNLIGASATHLYVESSVSTGAFYCGYQMTSDTPGSGLAIVALDAQTGEVTDIRWMRTSMPESGGTVSNDDDVYLAGYGQTSLTVCDTTISTSTQPGTSVLAL